MRENVRELLCPLEQAAPEDRWTTLCFLAGQQVELGEDELRGALRRSELLLAAGGDPRRALELHGRAVTALAADLDSPESRRRLYAGLIALAAETDGLPATDRARRQLLADPDLAWQSYACALLAEELGSEDDAE